MKKDLKLIVLGHYDFTDKVSGNQVKGSKVIITDGIHKIETSTKRDDVFGLELGSYVCDITINDELKVDIVNVRK